MNHDVLKLENQLCFPLYVVAKEVVKKYKPFLDEIGLTYTQYIAMMVLWEEKSVNIKLLGKKLYLDSGTLTPMLKKMESDGLLTRQRDANDERSVIVTLTNKGIMLKEKASDIPMKMSNCISLELSDIQTLYSLLYKLLGQLECEVTI